MKNILYMIFTLLVAVGLQGCKEDPRLDHNDPNAAAPQQVTDFKAENTPGGANITYKLSSDVNLAYVKALYEIQPGVFKESKSSIYTDTLKLEGFGDTNEHEVKIISVGRNEKESAPAIVKVKPLAPPVELAYNNLSIEAGFGGVKVRIKNDLQANLAIVVDADTTGNGLLRPLQTFYTKSAASSFSVRGLSATPKKFSVYLRDRWGNKSQAIIKDLTPLFEQRVPKPFAGYALPTDQAALGTNVLANIWDGLVNLSIYASNNNTPIPQWFTIDLKVPVVLSRMKAHQRTPPYTYVGACVKSFELWGSNAPASDGSWASWTLIGKFDSFKPSGGVGVTAEDNAYGFTNGEDFEMPDTPPAYRYLRFKTTETWGGTGQVTIAEITFWGKL
ncbi:DUF5000 domain-containing lipoprotein [Pedobacter sp. MC2016-24]|uniref:DUF5000 domain-containing lipoprotein n=1 Tax=Pedobacter sp. MC2016-24 TaxID=2780090 RepID=UPI0018820342|nr:DUF5000 domain-containing lipoprotein [Pedobacter sp. MC2016-24]MBE9600427.1 DUF4959 domain-containing protein [Pedobacter sp. MC2016-24]